MGAIPEVAAPTHSARPPRWRCPVEGCLENDLRAEGFPDFTALRRQHLDKHAVGICRGAIPPNFMHFHRLQYCRWCSRMLCSRCVSAAPHAHRLLALLALPLLPPMVRALLTRTSRRLARAGDMGPAPASLSYPRSRMSTLSVFRLSSMCQNSLEVRGLSASPGRICWDRFICFNIISR